MTRELEMSRGDFRALTILMGIYDRYPQYIEDGKQYDAACRQNDECVAGAEKILAKYGIEDKAHFIVSNFDDYATRDEKFATWLSDMGVPLAARRVWTEDEIRHLVATNDKVLYGALMKLYAEQTSDEQANGETRHHNGRGFNGTDSRFLSSVAEFLKKRGFLTDKQKYCVRRKLVKYNKQLTRLANAG